MSEMVERVARAICAKCGLDPNGPGPHAQGERIGPNWHMHAGLARAAIEAMREPTERMISYGNESAETCLKEDPCGKAGKHVWADMIDAALMGGK